MANKRKQKPLKVREPLARYILSGEPTAMLVDAERAQHASGESEAERDYGTGFVARKREQKQTREWLKERESLKVRVPIARYVLSRGTVRRHGSARAGGGPGAGKGNLLGREPARI